MPTQTDLSLFRSVLAHVSFPYILLDKSDVEKEDAFLIPRLHGLPFPFAQFFSFSLSLSLPISSFYTFT